MKDKKLLIHYMAMTVFYSLEIHYGEHGASVDNIKAIEDVGIPKKYRKKVLKALKKMQESRYGFSL